MGETSNFASDATFEEWKVKNYPVVTVEKTVEASFTRTFPWEIAKEADGEPTTSISSPATPRPSIGL